MGKKKLTGKVALVTGSSRGIGFATARGFAKQGAKVVLSARGKERLEEAADKLKSEGFEALAVPADVSSPEDCKMLIDKAVEHFGRLDVVVNNAGVSMRAPLEELDAETCRKVVDVNLLGCIYPTLYAIPQLKENKGSVVFISSIAGLLGLPTASLYCATKMALRGLADSIRCELAPDGVHVGVVYVGFTENDPEKKVIGSGNSDIDPDRPAYMSQEEVGANVVELVASRKREVALTPVGKLAKFGAWLSPKLIEDTIIFTRKHNISEKLGIR